MLSKAERLNKKIVIEKMFEHGASQSFVIFPFRIVYMPVESGETSILISVSKRYFKQAVKRNRVKRQIREAYRLNKKDLLDTLQQHNSGMVIAFMYLSNELIASEIISEKVRKALLCISKELS